MKLNDIITEADVRVSNTFSSAQKVSWLNEINNEFFDVVKIPAASLFTSIAGIAAYILHLLADPVAAPVLSQAANVGSTLPATNYYGFYTWQNAYGETLVSPEAGPFALAASNNLVMTVPALPTGATLTGVYIGNAAGNGTKQGTTNTTTFVQSKLLTAGAPAPLANTTNPIREKNIDKVHVGTAIYQSFLYEDMPPGRNSHMFSEATGTLTLTPAPLQNSPSLVRYYKTALQSYVSTNLNAVPEAPPEYHWIYILGLCERIAKAMGDVVRANNFGGDYRGNLQIAQQNFRKGA